MPRSASLLKPVGVRKRLPQFIPGHFRFGQFPGQTHRLLVQRGDLHTKRRMASLEARTPLKECYPCEDDARHQTHTSTISAECILSGLVPVSFLGMS